MTTSMVDWTVALNTATKLVKPGPEISREGAAAVVAELRSFADRAEAYVREVTGMDADSGTAPVLVVDRPRWIQANLDGFRQILLPLNAKVIERMNQSSSTVASVGPRITGVEVGALLSYLSSKVLGQFDPFFPGADPNAPGGRLLLVAPNIVAIERELDVEPADFRLWVCLHEETHRVQFAVSPVAARLSQRPDRPNRRLGRARPYGRGPDAAGCTEAGHRGGHAESRGVDHRLGANAGTAGNGRSGHRCDVAARGSC